MAAAGVSHERISCSTSTSSTRSNGWIVGRSGLILHSSDGGETWSEQKSGMEKHLFAVDFVDPQHGCAVGDWGAILATDDGGETWQPRPLPEDVILNDVDMVSPTEGWIAGEMGTILAYRGRGEDLDASRTAASRNPSSAFTSSMPQRGWAVGIDALILHTSDGGQTWQVLNGSTEVRALEQVGFAQAYDNPSLYADLRRRRHGGRRGRDRRHFSQRRRRHTWHARRR